MRAIRKKREDYLTICTRIDSTLAEMAICSRALNMSFLPTCSLSYFICSTLMYCSSKRVKLSIYIDSSMRHQNRNKENQKQPNENNKTKRHLCDTSLDTLQHCLQQGNQHCVGTNFTRDVCNKFNSSLSQTRQQSRGFIESIHSNILGGLLIVVDG